MNECVEFVTSYLHDILGQTQILRQKIKIHIKNINRIKVDSPQITFSLMENNQSLTKYLHDSDRN